MPKYWGKQIFAHGRFPEVGQKQRTDKRKKRKRKKVGLKLKILKGDSYFRPENIFSKSK